MTTAEKTESVAPRLKQRYRDEIAGELREQFSYAQRHADPRRGQGRRQHGCRRRRPRRQADRRRGPRPGHHHRPEAAGPPGHQVHRAVQAARGHADRREGHPAQRPHVGVPGPAADHRAAAYPRLPRPVADPVRRPGQLHVRAQRAVDVPRDRPRHASTGRAAWTSRSSPRPRPTRKAGRCCASSASRSRRREMAKKALVSRPRPSRSSRSAATPAARSAAARARCCASSACAGSASARWRTPASCRASARAAGRAAPLLATQVHTIATGPPGNQAGKQ